MVDRQALGKRLREMREARCLSQEVLAATAKVAHRALQRLEGGEGNPTLDTIENVADNLGTSLDTLFLAVCGGRADEARLLDIFRHLSAKGRAIAISQLESLLAFHEEKSRAGRRLP